MADLTSYHLAELEIIQQADHRNRCVPRFPCVGWDVLDVGCGIGQTLVASEFETAASRHGIDVDESAIKLGREKFPELILSVAAAERIPYGNDFFDLVFSRVALPYTDVPRALLEMHRVTKPNGLVWLALHSWQTEVSAISDALKHRSFRRLADLMYVLTNSVVLAVGDRCFPRPWSGTYESFQIAGHISMLMRKLAFEGVVTSASPHFCISARVVK